uniref:Peroxiredoxin-like 2 activated in M-CSF stimulated monocytes n=1 Tax=Oryzias melastigma TaxID=30732 RepID=A0A3B3C9Q7_ORYME
GTGYDVVQERVGLYLSVKTPIYLYSCTTFRKGSQGNVLGEGFVLGSVLVIGRDQQGILLEHGEIEFGDKVNISEVLHAARRVTPEL